MAEQRDGIVYDLAGKHGKISLESLQASIAAAYPERHDLPPADQDSATIAAQRARYLAAYPPKKRGSRLGRHLLRYHKEKNV